MEASGGRWWGVKMCLTDAREGWAPSGEGVSHHDIGLRPSSVRILFAAWASNRQEMEVSATAKAFGTAEGGSMAMVFHKLSHNPCSPVIQRPKFSSRNNPFAQPTHNHTTNVEVD